MLLPKQKARSRSRVRAFFYYLSSEYQIAQGKCAARAKPAISCELTEIHTNGGGEAIDNRKLLKIAEKSGASCSLERRNRQAAIRKAAAGRPFFFNSSAVPP
jgi:EAL domain-containing protein (putative c-di-GMP-specific phosphodiesterase class I)